MTSELNRVAENAVKETLFDFDPLSAAVLIVSHHDIESEIHSITTQFTPKYPDFDQPPQSWVRDLKIRHRTWRKYREAISD